MEQANAQLNSKTYVQIFNLCASPLIEFSNSVSIPTRLNTKIDHKSIALDETMEFNRLLILLLDHPLIINACEAEKHFRIKFGASADMAENDLALKLRLDGIYALPEIKEMLLKTIAQAGLVKRYWELSAHDCAANPQNLAKLIKSHGDNFSILDGLRVPAPLANLQKEMLDWAEDFQCK